MKSIGFGAQAVLLVIIVAIVAFNAVTLSGITDATGELIAETEEYNRAAEISLVTILDSDCEDCFDIEAVHEELHDINVKVVSEEALEYTDERAQELIASYGIERVPALIVMGEIDKDGSEIDGFTSVDDALLYEAPTPVYLELGSGEYKGLVTVVEIFTEDCVECTDFTDLIESLSVLFVIEDQDSLRLDEAEELIAQYGITALPAVIIGGDLDPYGIALSTLDSIAEYVDDAYVILSEDNPPYYDIETGEVAGVVTLTYLLDESCEDCYDHTVHTTILERAGVYIAEEIDIDVSSAEGQALVEDYAIEKYPTVLFSSDFGAYSALEESFLSQVGTLEDDGVYVFRSVEILSQDYVTVGEDDEA